MHSNSVLMSWKTTSPGSWDVADAHCENKKQTAIISRNQQVNFMPLVWQNPPPGVQFQQRLWQAVIFIDVYTHNRVLEKHVLAKTFI